MKAKLRVSQMTLGTAQFGLNYGITNTQGQVHPLEAKSILSEAHLQGIRTLDTAPAYGTSEEVLSELLGQLNIRDFRIISKTLPLAGGSLDATIARLDQSVALLGDYGLDTIFVHHEDDLLGPDGERIWKSLEDLKARGKIKRIGASFYTVGKLKSALEKFALEVIQVPFNALDRRFLSEDLINKYQNHRIEVHARSLFLQGLLFSSPNHLPAKTVFAQKTLLALKNLAESSYQQSPAVVSLSQGLLNQTISKCVFGVTTRKELLELLELPLVLRSEEFERGILPILESQDPRTIDPRTWK
ncbi:MAG: aldo/keto reductase [Oligoflexia bacterium]|nr:aldo/keto reductase [Oligoflexia bacterium]